MAALLPRQASSSSYDSAQNSSSSPSGAKIGLYVGIAAAIIVIKVTVITLLYRYCRKRRSKGSSSDKDEMAMRTYYKQQGQERAARAAHNKIDDPSYGGKDYYGGYGEAYFAKPELESTPYSGGLEAVVLHNGDQDVSQTYATDQQRRFANAKSPIEATVGPVELMPEPVPVIPEAERPRAN